jgi:3-methylcrotonyl-CoA carboxylase alpha subunit
LRALGEGRHEVVLGGHRHLLSVYAAGARIAVFGGAGSASLGLVDPLQHAAQGAGDGGRLSAPMPGKVISLLVTAGQTVRRGQALAVMEAMKMEHTISAPADGVVAELPYAVGDQVAEGAELLRLETVA